MLSFTDSGDESMNRIALVLVFAAAIALPAHAQQTDHSAARGDAQMSRAPSSVDGVVRKVDKRGKTIILKHGSIPNLDMGAMTMQYRVKDASLLDKVKAGDKVTFTAEMIDGQYTVTRLERAAK
jgi:Cu(I)/Ag(I) efflux system protein CusF